LVVGSPDIAKSVLQAPADVLCAGLANRRVVSWLLGESALVALSGERHISHRRLMLPPFHGRRLERHTETIRELSARRIESWPVGEELPALPRMRALMLDVVAHVLFGDAEPDRFGRICAALQALELPASVHGGNTPGFRPLLREVEVQVAGAIAERRVGSSDPGSDVLSTLLEARMEDGARLSDREVADELMTLIVTGTETTACSLAWALERLARSPDALAGVAEEAEGGAGPFTDAAIYETLRMRPAVPMVGRVARQPFELGDRRLEPGDDLAISVLLVHHCADAYPDPHEFRPERFLERSPGTYTWIPFGGGVRRCIGAGFALLEMRIVLSSLLARMKLRRAGSDAEGMLNRPISTAPAAGARVTLEWRWD
jgi:cytochrome P450